VTARKAIFAATCRNLEFAAMRAKFDLRTLCELPTGRPVPEFGQYELSASTTNILMRAVVSTAISFALP